MSLTSLLDKIASKQKDRQEAKIADYRDLVHQVADGKEPHASEVDRILCESNRSLDQLRQDVELLTKRREIRFRMDEAERLFDEQQQLERDITAMDTEFEESRKKHEDTIGPLRARLSTVKHAILDGHRARQELIDTCADESLLSEYEAVTTELSQAMGRRSDLMHEVRSLRAESESSEYQATREEWPTRIERYRNRAEECKELAEARDRELKQVEETVAELEQRERAICERMLVP